MEVGASYTVPAPIDGLVIGTVERCPPGEHIVTPLKMRDHPGIGARTGFSAYTAFGWCRRCHALWQAEYDVVAFQIEGEKKPARIWECSTTTDGTVVKGPRCGGWARDD